MKKFLRNLFFFSQNEHVAKLNEIFSQANRVTRRDKALILGFMGGCRENPMPSPENYIVIKLGETEVSVEPSRSLLQFEKLMIIVVFVICNLGAC